MDMKRTSVVLDKPIYTGFKVLELSKLHMYNSHYELMMSKCGPEKVKLLFTDTDSLTYQVTTPDLYKDLEKVSLTCLTPAITSESTHSIV